MTNTTLQVSYVFVLQNPAQAPAVGLVRRAMGSRGVDSRSENFKLLGLVSLAHLRKIELVRVWLLRKREGFGVEGLWWVRSRLSEAGARSLWHRIEEGSFGE